MKVKAVSWVFTNVPKKAIDKMGISSYYRVVEYSVEYRAMEMIRASPDLQQGRKAASSLTVDMHGGTLVTSLVTRKAMVSAGCRLSYPLRISR